MAQIKEVRVPDIGDFDAVDVVEILVAKGDSVQAEDPLISLESDKATMEVPSPEAGTVQEVKVEAGSKVAEGDVIVLLEVQEGAGEEDGGSEAAENGSAKEAPEETAAAPKSEATEEAAPRDEDGGEEEAASAEKGTPSSEEESPSIPAAAAPGADGAIDEEAFRKAYASPAVRRFARELGVDLGRVEGSGRKGRILKEDVQGFVKTALGQETPRPAAGGAFALPEMPVIDFSRFGPVESEPLSRIQKLSAANLHRSWLHVPHVTQHDEADVTEMEAFRKAHGEQAKAKGFKLTPVAFLLKAAVAALQEYPRVNSSLAPDGESLILKRYFHIGIAVDTPNGLVVPVIRDVDKKSLFDLAKELGEVSQRARDGRLKMDDLSGAGFTITSLGGIGGTAFTPIVNAPEVAILGVSRSVMKPVWSGEEFEPRLMLPLSLSYDHRVIDGALAVRFTTYLSWVLADLRRMLL